MKSSLRYAALLTITCTACLFLLQGCRQSNPSLVTTNSGTTFSSNFSPSSTTTVAVNSTTISITTVGRDDVQTIPSGWEQLLKSTIVSGKTTAGKTKTATTTAPDSGSTTNATSHATVSTGNTQKTTAGTTYWYNDPAYIDF